MSPNFPRSLQEVHRSIELSRSLLRDQSFGPFVTRRHTKNQHTICISVEILSGHEPCGREDGAESAFCCCDFWHVRGRVSVKSIGRQYSSSLPALFTMLKVVTHSSTAHFQEILLVRDQTRSTQMYFASSWVITMNLRTASSLCRSSHICHNMDEHICHNMDEFYFLVSQKKSCSAVHIHARAILVSFALLLHNIRAV